MDFKMEELIVLVPIVVTIGIFIVSPICEAIKHKKDEEE